jgi:hypothetical protein
VSNAKLHYKETVTTRRKEAAERLAAVLAAPRHDSMIPDMNLGYSLRALTPGQQEVVSAVLAAISKHPLTDDVPRLFQHVGNELIERNQEANRA